MTEKEIQEDGAILDMAVRRAGADLERGGVHVLQGHARVIEAMLRKMSRLEAAQTEAQEKSAAPVAGDTASPHASSQ